METVFSEGGYSILKDEIKDENGKVIKCDYYAYGPGNTPLKGPCSLADAKAAINKHKINEEFKVVLKKNPPSDPEPTRSGPSM